ncbi:MAG: DinB family protein [Blastocatellia bacterium]|nr:DinB family protein [Blastocatellia bacterium]
MNTQRLHSKSEIRDALKALRLDGLMFWADLAPDQFAAALGSAWSPADNVRHLAKATAPVALAFRLPRLALRVVFGVATEASRTFDDLRQTYLGVLGKGAKAGRFAPSPARPPADLGAWQQHLVGQCAGSLGTLEQALGPWSEEALDRYRLPHPLLGRLTAREMLLFTLYHYEHHKANVIRRMAGC